MWFNVYSPGIGRQYVQIGLEHFMKRYRFSISDKGRKEHIMEHCMKYSNQCWK